MNLLIKKMKIAYRLGFWAAFSGKGKSERDIKQFRFSGRGRYSKRLRADWKKGYCECTRLQQEVSTTTNENRTTHQTIAPAG